MSLFTTGELIDKVSDALGNGSWSLRRSGSSEPDWTWRAFTSYDQEEVQGHGATPQAALLSFLRAVLDQEQRTSAQHEDIARCSRDRVARVQRAIESL